MRHVGDNITFDTSSHNDKRRMMTSAESVRRYIKGKAAMSTEPPSKDGEKHYTGTGVTVTFGRGEMTVYERQMTPT